MLATSAVIITIFRLVPTLERACRLYAAIEISVQETRDLVGGPIMDWKRSLLCRFNFHEMTSRIDREGRPRLISDLSTEELHELTKRYCRHCGYSPDNERRNLLKGDHIV